MIIKNIDDLAALDVSPFSVILSKTSIGFGSPQVASFANSLAEHTQREVLILAPLRNELPPTSLQECGYTNQNLKIIYIDFRDLSSYREENHRYTRIVNHLLSRHQPEIFVLMHPALLVSLKDAIYRPSFIIMYLLESPPREKYLLDADYFSDWYEAIQPMKQLIDLVIFPEENRASLDMERMGLKDDAFDVEILYNSRSFPWPLPNIPEHERKNAFFYGGGIRKYQTCGMWFHVSEVQKFPINVYGWLREFDDPEAAAIAFNDHPYSLHYYGMLPTNASYYEILAQHAYSLILWAPVCENAQYAAPNKLFDALSCGVPVISGPTPLPQKLIQKYNCGLIMPDWELQSFINTLRHADKLFGTSQYSEMVEGCHRAMAEECDWETQFKVKILPHLQKYWTD